MCQAQFTAKKSATSRQNNQKNSKLLFLLNIVNAMKDSCAGWLTTVGGVLAGIIRPSTQRR
jgi:hypothetical protein